jgi:hypothetical protein
MGEHTERNAQFERIAELRGDYQERGSVVLSMDTKKRVGPGEFARPGSIIASVGIPVNDHDFPRAAKGKAIPHGIYDVNENRAYITIGTRHDTLSIVCFLMLLGRASVRSFALLMSSKSVLPSHHINRLIGERTNESQALSNQADYC